MKNLWPSPDDLEIATPHQRERAELAMRLPVGILGGNPGAGKTHLSAQVIKLAVRKFGVASCAVAAPTGKAAVRITEAMLGHGLASVEASTIHRLLGVSRNGHDQNGWGFMHNRTNPLPYRFLFIDEASMLGVNLAASLLEACLPGTHILFIGDFAQLPPVEHGAPLRDMIAAGLPYGELTEIHRNDGAIVRACRDLKEGRRFQPSPAIDLAAGANLKHIEAARPADALRALGELLRHVPSGLDPVWDVQVLCATNESSEVGRKNLNRGMQRILNPNGETIDGSDFRLGDKVICLTNGVLPMLECPECHAKPLADPDTGEPNPAGQIDWDGRRYTCWNCYWNWSPADALGDFVANGEIGKVVGLDKRLLHVKFDSPARTVRVAGGWVDEFDLAYAVTCHKSQGSQWPAVIVMADDSNGADMVTSWEWWRTAISRAEKICCTIGQKRTIDRQCKKSALKNRKTFLTEMLRGAA